MKILCVIPTYWPAFQFGGPIFSVHALNKALAEKGVSVTVFTTDAGLEKHVSSRGTDIDTVRVHYFSTSPFFGFLSPTGWGFSPGLFAQLKRSIRDFDLVYIVSVWNFSVAAAGYFCRANTIPYILSPRGLLYSYALEKKTWKKWPYYRLISRRDIQGAACIHYTSFDELACHTSLGLTNPFAVVPNGIPLEEYDEPVDRQAFFQRFPYLQGKRIVLFLGRITWKKGLDILIDAFARFHTAYPDAVLVLAGNDEAGFSALIKKRIQLNHIGEQVFFTGMLLGQAKRQAFAVCDVFVLPSYSENFGLSVIEAMAAGAPVVISDQVALAREAAELKAALVVEATAESLYTGLVAVFKDPDETRQRVKRAHQFVREKYDIHTIADQMIALFERVEKR